MLFFITLQLYRWNWLRRLRLFQLCYMLYK